MYVGCVLTDGSFVSGWLLSFSNHADDIADRDLTLSSPIKYRPAGSDTVVEQVGVGSVVVAARQIVLMFVSYVMGSVSDDLAAVSEAPQADGRVGDQPGCVAVRRDRFVPSG